MKKYSRFIVRTLFLSDDAEPDRLRWLPSIALPKNLPVKFVVLFVAVGKSRVGGKEFYAAQIVRLEFRQCRRLVDAENFLLAFIRCEIVHEEPCRGGMARLARDRGRHQNGDVRLGAHPFDGRAFAL